MEALKNLPNFAEKNVINTVDFLCQKSSFASLSDLFCPKQRVVVVAPHPDDEVIGCGGILYLLAKQHYEIIVVAVTDGEACYPALNVHDQMVMREQRHYESLLGLRRLGVRNIRHIRLSLPDGRVAEHRNLLVRRLGSILQANDAVITTWRHDHHPDHEATGEAVAECVKQQGIATLYETPIWMWHNTEHLAGSILERRAVRVLLDTAAQKSKQQAINAHATQFFSPASNCTPILNARLLSAWIRPWELLFV